MFTVYAVKLKPNGSKDRFFMGCFKTMGEAKHMANCATLGTADYSYVKELSSTVFFLKKPDPAILYGEGSIAPERCRPISPASAG